MENLVNRRLATGDRVGEFGENNPLTTPIASVTTLYMQVGTMTADLRGYERDQRSGQGEFRGGSSSRRLAADQLLGKMRPIAKIARSLNRQLFPGVREKFRMPRFGGYDGLVGAAEAFVVAIAPIKQVFVERGMAASFDADLTAAKNTLLAASGEKNTGLSQQVGGTAGLMAKSRQLMAAIGELDAILSHQYEDDPVRLAAWKSACRVERRVTAVPPPAPTSPSTPPNAS